MEKWGSFRALPQLTNFDRKFGKEYEEKISEGIIIPD